MPSPDEIEQSDAPGESPVDVFLDGSSILPGSTRTRSVELGFIRNMFALAIEIGVSR